MERGLATPSDSSFVLLGDHGGGGALLVSLVCLVVANDFSSMVFNCSARNKSEVYSERWFLKTID